MKRSDFLKSLMAGVALASIPSAMVFETEEAAVVDVLQAAKLQINQCYEFKISQAFYDQLTVEHGPMWMQNFTNDLDKLCIELTGYPVKEVGFQDDDFAKGIYTVRSFRQEIEDEKRGALDKEAWSVKV